MAHWDPPNKVRARAPALLRRCVLRRCPLLQLVITGDSSSVAATDTIVFTDAPTAGHTAIEYTAGASARGSARCFHCSPRSAACCADIRLKGLLSLFTIFVASDIRALGDAAKTGLERAFAEGKHTEPSS